MMATQEQKLIFRKMEEILFCYNKFRDKIKKDLDYLKNPVLLKQINIEKISGSGFMDVKAECERIEEYKIRISNDISRHEEILFRIDSALDMIKEHKDYNFIVDRYFNKKTYEEIAEAMNVEVRTVYRTRNNILSALEIHFKTQKLIEF
nr:MAG TPA: Protein of unknown function (DUF722) [Caudoviricetes sp.]